MHRFEQTIGLGQGAESLVPGLPEWPSERSRTRFESPPELDVKLYGRAPEALRFDGLPAHLNPLDRREARDRFAPRPLVELGPVVPELLRGLEEIVRLKQRQGGPSVEYSQRIASLYELAARAIYEAPTRGGARLARRDRHLVAVNQGGLIAAHGVRRVLEVGSTSVVQLARSIELSGITRQQETDRLGSTDATELVEGQEVGIGGLPELKAGDAYRLSADWQFPKTFDDPDRIEVILLDVATASGRSDARIIDLLERLYGFPPERCTVLALYAAPLGIEALAEIGLGRLYAAHVCSGLDRWGYIVEKTDRGYTGLVGEVDSWIEPTTFDPGGPKPRYPFAGWRRST